MRPKILGRTAHCGPIAIDIGTAGIKLLQIESGSDRPIVTAAAWRAFAPDLDAAQREAVAHEVITAALQNGQFRGRRAVMALHSRDFQIKSFRMPQMPHEELATALEFEAEERFGFGEDKGQYRFVVAGEVRHGTELKEELIVFGVRGSVLQSLLGRLEALKLEPAAIDVAPCAMARSFARFLRRTEDMAAMNVFLDIGRSGTCMVVTRGPDVAFVKVVDIGGAKFDEAVAERLGMSVEQANEMRRNVMMQSGGRRARDTAAEAGESVPDAVREQVAGALQPVIEQLAKDVQLCLRYFAVTFRGQKPASVTFAGGEAHEPALAERVSDIVQIPCLVGDPLRGMAMGPGVRLPADWTYRPGWGVVTGLALREVLQDLQPRPISNAPAESRAAS